MGEVLCNKVKISFLNSGLSLRLQRSSLLFWISRFIEVCSYFLPVLLLILLTPRSSSCTSIFPPSVHFSQTNSARHLLYFFSITGYAAFYFIPRASLFIDCERAV